MATLEQAIWAKEDIVRRARGAPWLASIGIGLAGDGYDVELGSLDPRVRVPAFWRGVPVRLELGPRAVPHGISARRWEGRRELFRALDADGDGVVTRREMEGGLGRAARAVLEGEAGAVDARSWSGRPDLFHLVDLDHDGRVTRAELEDALGRRGAELLVHDRPGIGPELPAGAEPVWTARGIWVVFKDREDKAGYMQLGAEHDARDPSVLRWAARFCRLPIEARAGAILRFCQRALRYAHDPAWWDEDGVRHGIELLDSAAVGLHRGYGDCDLLSRLFVALCLASGLRARIAPVFRGAKGFPHVRAKVVASDPEGEAGEPPRWLVADPTLRGTIGHPIHAPVWSKEL